MRAGAVVFGIIFAAGCYEDPRFATLQMVTPPAALASQPAATEATLANGLRVAVLRDPRAPLVSIDLRYEVGAADDPPDRPGLALEVAHLLAHAATRDRGSGASPDVDLTLHVAVDLDRTELTTTAIDVQLGAALELAARRLETSCADFDAPAIARAQTEAIAQLWGPPPSLAAAVFGPAHPYAHPIGTPALADATADTLCAFYADRYAPAAATLVVAGPVDDTVLATIRARFEHIPRGKLARRAPVAAIEPTQTWTRTPVFGLEHPTAMLVFPALGAPDPADADVQLAIRRFEHSGVRVFVLGGERVRAIVVAEEVEGETKLAAAHDDLEAALHDAASTLEEYADETQLSDAQLASAQRPDDVLARGGDLAARIVHPAAPHERDTSTGAVRRWIRANLSLAAARRIDAVPPPGASAQTIPLDALAQVPSSIDPGIVVGDPSALIARPLRAPRPLDQLDLPNGLHVVLAPDPRARAIDLRLVLPVGTRNADPHADAQLVRNAAAKLVAFDDSDVTDAARLLRWYATAVGQTSVDVTATSTVFHTIGLANLADWHLFAMAWLVSAGHYAHDVKAPELAQLAQFRAQAYRPAGATLIVSGGFDPREMRASVMRWFGSWTAPPASAPLPVTPPPARVVAQHHGDGVLEVQLALRPHVAAKTAAERAARALVALVVQERLAALLGEHGSITATYQPRADEMLTIAVQLDPARGAAAAATLDRELTQLAGGASATIEELSRARRVAIAERLASSIGAAGRAQQLEEAVELGASLDEADQEVDAMRTVTGDDLRAAAAALLAR